MEIANEENFLLLRSLISIDLAGSENNKSGLAFFHKKEKNKIITKTVFKDLEILKHAKAFRYCFIDAPLSLPKGRKSINEKNENHFRYCDILLRKMKIKFFPITINGMRKLTERGIKIKNVLEKMNIACYEIFPGASYDILKIKRKDLSEQIKFYRSLKIKVNIKNQHESDAVIGLLTGLLYIFGKAVVLKGEDGSIIIPKKNSLHFLKNFFK